MTVSNIRGVHAFLTSTIKPSVIQNGDEKISPLSNTRHPSDKSHVKPILPEVK